MNFSDELEHSGLSPKDPIETIRHSDNTESEDFTTLEASEESEKEMEVSSSLPFDPKLIKITVETITIYGITERLKDGAIDLYPKFQRKANLWDDGRKSRLIESILLRFPIPAFYFDIQNEDNWLVVDGLQRLSTLKHFIVDNENPLILTGLEILKDLENKSFRELDSTLKRRILETNLTTFQIQAGTPKDVKYNIFKRINTGGLGLTPMEIRHALNQKGPATDFFDQLTGTGISFFNNFIAENRISITRMEDRELVLRYVAFSLSSFTEYKSPLGDFLDRAMENLDTLTKIECNLLIENLTKSIDCYEGIFGNTRFGRGFTRRAKMNSALFEVWTSELAKLTDEHRQILILNKDKLKETYESVLYDPAFHKSIVSSTANKGAVETRFNIIHELIQAHLENAK